MAVYRNVQISFWTDSKVIDDFTPEDRLFYLYLFTNPHTNLCGCYEISKRQVAIETGYSKEAVEKLLTRFEFDHDVIRYSPDTKEILILNWHKYNWTTSEKFRKPLLKEINTVKDERFKSYLMSAFDGSGNTVSIRYGYRMDTTDTDTDTDTVSDTVSEEKEQLEDLPPAFVLPCKNDEEYIVTQGEYQELVDLYPNLDVMKQLRLMKGWLMGNKSKNKPKGDMPRFIYGWLNNEAKDKKASPEDEKPKTKNNLGVFGDYKQSSTDDEWDDLTALALREVNYGS